MIKFQCMPIINSDAIQKEYGIRVFDCEFAQGAERDSYQYFACDNAQLSFLWEEYEWHKDKESAYAQRLKNDIDLIERIQDDFGDIHEVLIYISW